MWATIDPEWIPSPWGDSIVAELEAAHETAIQPIPARAIERMLRDAWGADPTEELDELDLEPFAITPSAQVHRGVLEGDSVAIKVLRPGLAAGVRQDLALLESLMAPLRSAFPALDAGAIVSEFRERVLDELDLEHEATVQRHFHRRLRGHQLFTVPAPITRLATENVLVSEWIDAPTFWDAPDPDRAAAALLVFVLGAGRHGYVHADPNPDDVLVLDDGRLAILDFGAVRAVSAERSDLAADVVDAFAEEDAQALGTALERVGWLPAGEAEGALELTLEVLEDLAGLDPALLDSDAVIAARDRLIDRPRALARLIAAGRLPPEDLWPQRGVAQAFAMIARLGATGPWRELMRAALRQGWDAEI